MEAFHSFCFRTKDPETLTDAGLSVDLDSVVRMDLFCTLIHGMDNNWKNTFLIARKTPEGYSLYRTIWDMNYSFGDVFIYQPEENYVVFDPDTARSLKSREDSTFDYAAFLETDPELEDSLRKLWTSWRQAGISASSVCGTAEKNIISALLLPSRPSSKTTSCWILSADVPCSMPLGSPYRGLWLET